MEQLKQVLTIYSATEDKLIYNRSFPEIKEIIAQIFGTTYYVLELPDSDNIEAEELFTLLEAYAPILTRGNLVALKPEEVARLSWQDTIDYLAKLRDEEIVGTYQADTNYSEDNRDDWLEHLTRTFHENNFMRFTFLGEQLYDISASSIKLSRVVNSLFYLPRHRFDVPENPILFGTQTSFYVYDMGEIFNNDEITNGRFDIKRAENDPSRQTGGDFFSSDEIMTFEEYMTGDYSELFAYHRPLATKERQRKMHSILRQAAYRTNDPKIQEELMARNIR